MDEVYDGVYISDMADAMEVDKSGFDTVITVCQDSIADNVGCRYLHFNMSDGPADTYGGSSDYELFESAAVAVLDCIESGETVLIHCHAGMSRSVTVTVAALGVHLDRRYKSVESMVKEARPQIRPDPLLIRHAMQFIEKNTRYQLLDDG